MTKTKIIAWAALLLALGAAPAEAGWSAGKQVEAARLIEKFLKPNGDAGLPRAPAMSLAIGVDGELVWARGFGEAQPGVVATPDTLYRIGSLTKQFTAAAVLHLIEDGATSKVTGKPLTLDAPLADFFDGVEAWTVEGQQPITVRSLLNMTSNLPNFTRRPPTGLDPWGAISAPRLLAAVKSYRRTGWPNSFEYSNTSYFLLAELIEATRSPKDGEHLDYRSLLRNAIFARAGLAATGFVGDAAFARQLSYGTFRRGAVFSEPDWLKGSGDMVSTAADMFRWNKALLSGAIISAEMLDSMMTEGGRISPLVYYGMGWFIAPNGSWTHYTHTGLVPGFTSCNAIARKGPHDPWISVTLMTNSDSVEGIDQLSEDLLQLIEMD